MSADRDPMDEFEFRPLTEGLGFHPKSTESSTQTPSFRAPPSEPISLRSTSVPSSNKPEIHFPNLSPPPIPRGELGPWAASTASSTTEQKTGPSTSSSAGVTTDPRTRLGSGSTTPQLRRQTPSVDQVLSDLKNRRPLDFTEPLPIQWKPTTSSPAAMTLDAMLVVAGYLCCLIALLGFAKVDFTRTLFSTGGLELAGLLVAWFFCLVWIYSVASRAFLGFTPGEWVADQRVGTQDQVGTARYTLAVVARASIVIATGLIVLPILHWTMGRDWLGRALGAELLERP